MKTARVAARVGWKWPIDRALIQAFYLHFSKYITFRHIHEPLIYLDYISNTHIYMHETV